MSKEEVLLQLVLDKFSNIKDILNSTKDIEEYLTKLKLNEKSEPMDVICEKAKSLVESLHDHSLKIKDDFYKHYNTLSSPLEKESCEENSVLSEEQNVSATEESTTVNNHIAENTNLTANENALIKGKNAENINASADSETDVSGSSKKNNPVENNEKDNTTLEKGVDIRNEDNAVLENDASSSSSDESITDVENGDDANIVECSSSSKSKENNSDLPEEINDSLTNHLPSDPLEIQMETSTDIIDSSIIDETNKNEDKTSAVEGKNECSTDETEVKYEPKIRLVDLSKLIDPKPKKSVKFDSSVIILTSSDEESATPKKKNDVKDQNGKLKSALKPSPDKITNYSRETKSKNKCEEKASHKKPASRNESGSDENEISASDSERKNKETRGKNRTKGSTKLEKRRSLTEKNTYSDSDAEEEPREEKNKKRSDDSSKKKNKENPSDSETSDSAPAKKKVKEDEKKNKEDSSSSDCVVQEDSDADIQKSNDSSEGRRSRRLIQNSAVKQKEKERIKTLFKRKADKHGRSRFEIVNRKSQKNSGSESDSDNQKRRPSGKSKDLIEEHLSDTSSLSDDENEDVLMKERVKKKKKHSKRKGDLSVDTEDKKFGYKVYISLPRVECERMKEIYLRNKEILEVKSLTNDNISKSSKRSRKKRDSKSSSDTDKPKSKKSKTSKKTTDDEMEESSDDESLIGLSKKLAENADEKNEENRGESPKPIENEDERMADIIMDTMPDEDEKPDESDNGSEEESNKSKKEDQQKEEDTASKDKNDKRKGKDSDEGEDVQSKDKNEESESKDEEEHAQSKNNDDEEEDKDGSTQDDNKDDDKKTDDDSGSSSDMEKKKDKKKWRSDKLLTTRLDSTDSEAEFSKYSKKKEKSKVEDTSDDEENTPITSKRKGKGKKRIKKKVISDSDESGHEKDKSDDESSEESEKSEEKSSSSEAEKQKKPARRRIRGAKNSSSSSEEDKSTRKHIRRLIGKDALSETTKQAEAEEKERKARIAEKQKKYNQIYESVAESQVDKVVLDYDEKEKNELLSVHKSLVKKLKPHQASGIQFMWDACFESLERAKSTKGSGCILAHCMGLGKTLQVIALAHTLLSNSKKTEVEKIMVVCPVNTVLNWKSEFKKWLPKNHNIEVYELVNKKNYERQYAIQEWHSDGGVLIIGYSMFRNLSNPDNKRISKKMRGVFQTGLVDPGPDLVVCDEGHLLKNEKTHLSIAMNRIKTARRIVLTGTPLQNNLKEYWCMVQFIKPNLLGTYKEYLNRFVNPITNGQYTDSTQHDIVLMRKRSHVLHKLLDGVVQRRDYGVLEPYLPHKHEYVLFVNLTETQIKMYKHYMERYARQSDGSNRTSFLFTDFQQLQRICTHPRVLLDKSKERKEKFESDSEGSLRDFINDDEASASSSSNSSSSKSGSDSDESGSDKKEKTSKGKQQRTRVTRAQAALKRGSDDHSDSEPEEVVAKEWWQEYCDGDELDNINRSGKLFLLFQILKECEDIGDKILVFSQSLYTLNCIEYFLQRIDEATQEGNTEKVGGHSGSWAIGLDYFRLDGSSSCDNRATWCDNFNNPDNTRARLFLISTKAGGLGINLVAANRVIIFDVSWNPSHDIQSIYRVYRFGQTKPCYIYRFVSYGTMEMKIYERQVTKQAISKRVIDEQQIDRHYNQNDLQELYKCDLEPSDRPIPLVPKDVLLGEMLQKYDKTIYQYHLHQSLLENKEDEGLNEEERKAAWEEFENEKVLRKNTTSGIFSNYNMNAHAIAAALASIVRKDNPTWSEVQIKGIIPALVQQLQVQLSEGDLTMYTRVQQEMQLMQAIQARKMKEAYYQQQVMHMIQQQQQQAKLLGNMSVDPVQIARAQASILNNYLGNVPGGPSSAALPRQMSNDVIELND